MELALEAGADDVKQSDGAHEILTATEDYATVSEAVSEKGLETIESGIRYLPIEGTEVGVTDAEHAQKIMKLIDLLEDDDDVQSVYTNMDVSDEVVAALNS